MDFMGLRLRNEAKKSGENKVLAPFVATSISLLKLEAFYDRAADQRSCLHKVSAWIKL